MKRLLVYPQPSSGESVSSYLSTLAEKNGFRKIGSMMKCHFKDSSVTQDDITKSDLVRLTGHTVDIVDQVGLTKSDNHFQPHYYYYNLAIPSYHLRSYQLVCSSCIKEKASLDARWRIAWLPYCLRHQALLVRPDVQDDHFPTTNGLMASNDDVYNDRLLTVQKAIEEKLDYESRILVSLPHQDSVVTLIDYHLKKAIGDGRFNSYSNRRRKYSKRFFPLNQQDTLKFLDCLYTQKAA